MTFRSVAVCVLGAVCLLGAEPDPDLTQIRSIYLLPMSAGLDQYLANRLTQTGRFQVATNPLSADAVFTDRLGVEFEQRFAELYPEVKPEEPRSDKEKSDETIGALLSQASGTGPRQSTFTRGKGNVFLVDRLTRRVLWSQFLRPRSSRPEDLDKVAQTVASGLAGSANRIEKILQKKGITPQPRPQSWAPVPSPPPGTNVNP